jgi:hypothetical protein
VAEAVAVEDALRSAVETAVAAGWSFPKIASVVMACFEEATPGETG